MFCPKCGFQNADDSRFCGKCGCAMPQAAAPRAASPGPVPNAQTPPPPYAAAYAQGASGAPAGQRTVTPEMLNTQWYYQIAQTVYGPLTSVMLLQLVRDRVLNFDTPVKRAPAQANPADTGWAPLHQTVLADLYYSGVWQQGNQEDVFKSGVKAFQKTINAITGDSGKLNITFSQLFSDVFKKHSTAEGERIFISGTSLTTPPESSLAGDWPKPWLFARVFLMLAATFAILWGTCLAFGWESSANVIPGLIFMGALAVPFSVIVFFMEINAPRNISFFQIIRVFFIGGALSLLLTLFLDQIFPVEKLDVIGATVTGVIEEIGKLAIVLIFIRGTRTKYILNGLLIGAAVGAGFAVFETAGYALLQSSTYEDIISILFLRGVLSFGGHVAWAAVSGAAIVMVKKGEPLSSKHIFSGKFLQLFIVPVILHAIWDMPIYFNTKLDEFCPVQIILTVIIWFFIIKIINSGLRQIEESNTPPIAMSQP